MPSQELLKREFVHHIATAILLLGGDIEFVNRIRAVEETPLTEEVITDIMNFCIKEHERMKDIFGNIPTISIRPSDNP